MSIIFLKIFKKPQLYKSLIRYLYIFFSEAGFIKYRFSLNLATILQPIICLLQQNQQRANPTSWKLYNITNIRITQYQSFSHKRERHNYLTSRWELNHFSFLGVHGEKSWETLPKIEQKFPGFQSCISWNVVYLIQY